MPRLLLSTLVALCLFGHVVVPAMAEEAPLGGVRRVVFLGDSITYAGNFIEFIETYLRLKDPTFQCEFLNLGLPSETVSGLTEPGHAGGSFPRPELRERLDRVLQRTKPDLIVACYGMNDGIYHPFAEERFRKYQDGIRLLRERAMAIGVKVVHLTPPVFDPLPIKAKTLPAGLAEYRQPYEGYDEVLSRYSEWLLGRKAEGWEVVDLHGPMKQRLADERKRDPNFRFAPDGVHLDAAGHRIIARQLLQHWTALPLDAPDSFDTLESSPLGRDVLALVQKKQRLLKDAWLSATGHTRPGMAKGLPLTEANRTAGAIDAEIRKQLSPKS